MRRSPVGFKLLFGTVLAALLTFAGAFALTADSIRESSAPAPVVFVCRNGVAMSVWSAAYFNRLAESRGLRERAVSRATIPSFRAVPASMELALALDGFRLDGYSPAVVSGDDVRRAEIVVAIDIELPSETLPRSGEIERWQGFPPMREQYFSSRRELKARVESLVERLAAAAPSLAPGTSSSAAGD